MTQRNIKNILFIILTGILTLCILSLSLIRVFYGVEITDEAFVISESVLVNNGATPFVDNWSQTPGFVLLARLPALIWNIFKTDYEGIFLFYRLSFLFFKTLILGFCLFLFIKSGIAKFGSFISVLVLVPFYIYVPDFHYNNLSVFMLLFIGCISIYCNEKQGIYSLPLHLIIGGLMDLCIYMHPSDLLACAVLLACIAICSRVSGKCRVIFEICIGGVLAAIIVTVWMVLRGGGITKLLYGLDSILNYNAYFELPISSFSDTTMELLHFAKPFLFIFLGTVLFKCICRYIFKCNRISNIIYGIIFLLISCIYILKLYSGVYIESAFGIVITIYLLYRFKDIALRKALFQMYMCIFLPQLAACISISYFSYGSAVYRFAYTIPCAVVILQDIFESIHSAYTSKTCLLICAFVFFLIINKSNYLYVYREEPISNLTCRVESGIYKGIYTTPEKKELYEELEKHIHSMINSEDSVLFMEVVPMAYLMTNARYCTPSTWDIMLYTYGFNDDTIMKRYFETVGEMPDYIVYIDTGRDACLSIEKDDYLFTQFVLSNYEKQSETEFGNSLEIILYEKIV